MAKKKEKGLGTAMDPHGKTKDTTHQVGGERVLFARQRHNRQETRDKGQDGRSDVAG